MTGSADVIILSSSPNPPLRSPARPDYDSETILGLTPRCASPPPMPSPSDLPGLPSRSRFFPTECTAGERVDIARKTKALPTKKVYSVANTDDTGETRKPRRKTKKDADELESADPANPGPASVYSKHVSVEKSAELQRGRSRTKAKNKGQGNMALAGKVTKAGTDSKSGKEVTATRRSPVENSEQPVPKKSNSLAEGEGLHLEEAMRRRLDWTPPPETTPSNAVVVDDVDAQENGCDSTDMGGFGKLLSDYSFSGLSSASRGRLQKTDGAGPTKRRRIELMNQSSANEKALDSNEDASVQGDDSTSSGTKLKMKTKGQSKRFKTLTARMTAQYGSNLQEDDSIGDMPDAGQGNPKLRGQSRSKRNDPEIAVLSPEAAAKIFDQQDLVFGTCSQLERENSPQGLKALQQAIQASENLALEERGKSSNAQIGQSAAHKPSFARSVSRLAGTRNLWCLASRDTDGSLTQANALDVVDLTNASEAPLRKDQNEAREPASKRKEEDWVELDDGMPSSPHRQIHSLPVKSSTFTTVLRAPVSGLESAKNAESTQPDKHGDNHVDSQLPSMPQYSGFTDAELSKQVASYGFKSIRGRKKMIDLLQKCWESKYGGTDESAATENQAMTQPEHSRASTTAQPQSDETTTQDIAQSTAKSKARRKPKPSKSTSPSSKMRRDSHTTSLAATARNKPGPKAKSMQSPQKSARAHSPTITTRPTSFIDVEEIQDSEEETILSPSQVQKRYTDIYSSAGGRREPCLDVSTKAPLPSPTKRHQPAYSSSSSKFSSSAHLLPSRLTTKLDRTDSSKRSSLPDMAVQISKAVRAQPRLSPLSSSLPSNSHSRSHPTWHEKILMYDPIILEDLTAWLNVEGLGLVGEDREVSPGLVREWCESKGICCCWKKNASW